MLKPIGFLIQRHMPRNGQVIPDYSRETMSADKANIIEASPRVSKSCEYDKGVCSVCGIGDDCGICDFCGSFGSKPPRKPLVLCRANACLPDCGVNGPCASCIGNKKEWIAVCERQGYDICHECLYFSDSCKCKLIPLPPLPPLPPSPPTMPLVLCRSNACLPGCGKDGPCFACIGNKQAWIEECERQGHDICHKCLHYSYACRCCITLRGHPNTVSMNRVVNIPPPPKPLVLARADACLPDCGINGPCDSCIGNNQAWIDECERQGHDICHKCLYYSYSCVCK